MIRLSLVLLAAMPLFAQDSLLFPRFSVTAGSSAGEFETNARIDPDDASSQGTLIRFERDLGLDDAKTLPRFGLQWRPFTRHELAASHFAASREGFAQIDREIVGIGITLGLATLAFDASVIAERPGKSVAITQEANTDVPVALAGVQGRVAFLDRLHAEASVSTHPRVTIEDYTGSALTGTARLEYRPLRWLGIGAAYNYFRLDVDVEATDLL